MNLHQKKPNIYEFARLSNEQKLELLQSHGRLVDTDIDQNLTVTTWLLFGYSVEEARESQSGKLFEILPYKYACRVPQKNRLSGKLPFIAA